MDRKELEGKSKADLVAMGQGLGFQVNPAMTKPQILDILSAADVPLSPAAQLNAIVAGAADPEEGAARAARVAEQMAKAEERRNPLPREGVLRSLDGKPIGGRKWRVTINQTEQETGDVFLSINGHGLQIKRGVPVVIDDAYLEVLKNTMIHTRTEEDGSRAKMIPRYSYQVEPA